MISMTSVVQSPVATAQPVPPPPPADPVALKSGRDSAPGQLAKPAVAEARAAGVDLPANAQGKAASQIAKGADAAALFTLQTEGGDTPADAPEGDSVPVGDVAIPSVAGETPATSGRPATKDSFAGNALAPAAQEGAEAAKVAALAYQVSATVFAGSGDSSAHVALDLLS